MSRKLVTVIPGLKEVYRGRIEACARAHGFEALFFESAAQALPHLADAEIVFGQDGRLAQSVPKLGWLCTPSAGINQFTGEGAFLNPNALLTNSSGAYGVTISEHVIMVTLEILRRQREYEAIVARREWRRDLPVSSLHGIRALLLGTGDIGCEVAARLRAFGPESLVGVNRSGRNPRMLFDRIETEEKLDELLPACELAVLSLPDTPGTFRMLDKRRLRLLPDGTVIVNVGRGSVIDQEALARELASRRLYAALDVFKQEPLNRDDPLWDCPNLILTPHVSGNMTLPYTIDRIVQMFLEDLERYCRGERLTHLVDIRRGY
jgi:phosphoglycerate dehydrogenase-like enzyme